MGAGSEASHTHAAALLPLRGPPQAPTLIFLPFQREAFPAFPPSLRLLSHDVCVLVILSRDGSGKRGSVAVFAMVSTQSLRLESLRRQNGIISPLHQDNLFQFSDNQADILSSSDPEAFFFSSSSSSGSKRANVMHVRPSAPSASSPKSPQRRTE